MIANPYYLWPHHGDETYELSAGLSIGGTDDAVPIETLPSETATAVREAIGAYETDAEPPVYENRGEIPTDGLGYEWGRAVVTVNGTDYVVTISERDRSPPVSPRVRSFAQRWDSLLRWR